MGFLRPIHALILACTLLLGCAIQPGNAAAVRGLPDFTGLVEKNSPAVVNISTSRTEVAANVLPPGVEIPDLPEGSPFGDFMRRFFGDQMPGAPSQDTQSLGSGFIISEDGFIVTNHHVVKEADEIIVRLSDRRQLEASVIGSDERSDIAVLKVEADDLPVLELGSSEDVKVGEWVLAIGSPFGFDHSVTAGIVSAKGRNLPSESYVPFIQTDVAINPGNSGGPLFNLDGQVVGVNAQIYSRTGGFMGLSFAIPIDVAMNVAEQLKTGGRVSRGWLGVFIQEVTRELAESFGMDKPTGALVAKVLPGSPAEEAGVKLGDVIVAFAGSEVTNSSALPPMVGRTKVGETAPVEIIRGGQSMSLDVLIGKLPDDDATIVASIRDDISRDEILGVELQELTDEVREQQGLEDGLIVKQVIDGPARDAGLQEGDIILMLNNQKLSKVKDYNDLVKDLPKGKFASLLVQRDQDRGPEFVAIKVPG